VALSNELKQLLACPKCRGTLEFRDDPAEIRCPACRLSYPVVDDIPVLLVDQAMPFQAGASEPKVG